jgi:competence protein ComEC
MLRGRTSFGLFFALGLIPAVWLSLACRHWLPAAALAAAVLAASALVLLCTGAAAACRWAGLLLLAAALGCGGGLARTIGWPGVRPGLPAGERVTAFEGILLSDSTLAPAGETRYELALRCLQRGSGSLRTSAAGRVLVLARDGPRAGRGQRLIVRVEPERFRSGDENGRESSSAGMFPLVRRARAGAVETAGYSARIWAARFRLLEAVERRIDRIGAPASALFRALFLGEREGIPPALQESFTRSGSLHLLALSGLHVGIVVLLAAGCLFWVPSRAWRAAAGALLAGAYLFLVGPRPSLSRAVIMLVAGSLGALLDRDLDALNLLGLSAAVLVLLDPPVLATLSFQLSYLALFGILLAGGPLDRRLSRFVPPFLSLPLASSIGAYLFTSPLLLDAFGSTYPVGILAAPVLIPLATLFIGGGLVFTLLPIGLLDGILGRLLDAVYRLIDLLAALLARAPGLTVGGTAAGGAGGGGGAAFWPAVQALLILAVAAWGIGRRDGRGRQPCIPRPASGITAGRP